MTLGASTVLILRQRREMQKQRDEARQAVDDMYTGVAEKWLSQQAALRASAGIVPSEGAEYYQRFAAEANNDPTVRLATAIAYRRVGGIQEKLGHTKEARSALMRSIALLESLIAVAGPVPEYRFDLAASECTLATQCWNSGPQSEAELLVRRAIATLEKLSTEVPSRPEYRYELSKAHNTLAAVLRATDPTGMLAAIRRAAALTKQLAEELPSEAKYRVALARTYGNLGLLSGEQTAVARAIEVCDQLALDFPAAPDHRKVLAENLGLMAQFLNADNRGSEAEALFRRAVGVEEKLVTDSPTVLSYRELLAMDLGNLGQLVLDAGRLDEAEPLLRRAAVLLESLREASPGSPDPRHFLANARKDLGRLLGQAERLAEAEKESRQAISEWAGLVSANPGVAAYKRELAAARYQYAELLHRGGKLGDAETERREAINLLSTLSDAPSQATLAWILATISDPKLRNGKSAVDLVGSAVAGSPSSASYQQVLGVARYRCGDWKGAIEAIEKSAALRRGGNAIDWFFLSMAQSQLGDRAKARSSYHNASQIMDKGNSRDLELRRFRAESAALLDAIVHSNPATQTEVDSKRTAKP